ncbi:MAG: exonuclease SbcCD subunit D [Paludibacteraceae bacterium]|nr:exonuclease SbcCD subunit D [Paludibacteraceae bacterium]
MKILHTSDWHLGHTLYGYDRTVEHKAMLEQMVEIVREHRPDVFLLAGDVYHTSQPSSAVQTMFSEAMVSLHQAHPEMYIVVIAGNHDSASKHEIFTTPWRALNVYAIGNLDKEYPEKHIIEVPEKGVVLAVPYAYERNIPDGFFQELIDLNRTTELPIVLMAHTTVKGADITGHDKRYTDQVGGIDYIEVEKMGKGYDYLALGHIHKPQYIHTGKHNVRYSGTPIPVSFDEDYKHSVSLLEVNKGETPIIKELEIKNTFPLITLPNQDYATWDEAKDLLRNFPDEVPAYIRLNVLVEGFLPPNAKDEAYKITEGKQCKVCLLNAKQKNNATSETHSFSVQELQEMNPLDIAINYAQTIGAELDDEMQEMFKQVLTLTNREEN